MTAWPDDETRKPVLTNDVSVNPPRSVPVGPEAERSRSRSRHRNKTANRDSAGQAEGNVGRPDQVLAQSEASRFRSKLRIRPP